jgi:putative Mg2+ transporter-C (MgtC) family protein
MTLSVLDMLGRVVTAASLAAVIGLEREARRHPAGVRTHALVAIGACLFTITGAYGFTDVSNGVMDPSRTAAQVATGIGFVGAGAILRTSESVRGQTTAATLWFTAALGVTVGAGGYVAASVSAGVVFAILVGLRALKRWLPGHQSTLIEVEYRRGHGTLGPLLRELEGVSLLEHVAVHDDDADALADDGLRRVMLQLATQNEVGLAQVCDRVRIRPEVRSVSIRTAKPDDRSTLHSPATGPHQRWRRHALDTSAAPSHCDE